MSALERSSAFSFVPAVAAEPNPLAARRIRRCNFRRLTALETRFGQAYDVDCCHPGGNACIQLGDLQTATPICNACVAPGTFRDDED